MKWWWAPSSWGRVDEVAGAVGEEDAEVIGSVVVDDGVSGAIGMVDDDVVGSGAVEDEVESPVVISTGADVYPMQSYLV